MSNAYAESTQVTAAARAAIPTDQTEEATALDLDGRGDGRVGAHLCSFRIDGYCGDYPVEREACLPVHLGHSSRGGPFEPAEAGFVPQHNGRVEIAHVRPTVALLASLLESQETAQEIGAVKAGEVTLDDVDHAPKLGLRGAGPKPRKP